MLSDHDDDDDDNDDVVANCYGCSIMHNACMHWTQMRYTDRNVIGFYENLSLI